MSININSLFEHLEELKKRVVVSVISILVISVLTFGFAVKEYVFGGFKFYFLYPELFSGQVISSQIFTLIKKDILPAGVNLIVTEPQEGILALLYVSVFLAILFSMPIIVYEVYSFVSPGLYAHEKKLMAKLILPSTFLFAGGCIFAYVSIIPFAMNFLYAYASTLQAITYITIDSFITFVLLFMLGFGVAFQLPVIMVALSSIDVVPAKFWISNVKYAFVALAVFGAIITPDGSGITMWLVALPMLLLYLAGYFVASRYKIRFSPPSEPRVLPPNVKGLIVSMFFGVMILGYSIFTFEFKTLPTQTLIVGMLLIAVYVASIRQSWKEDLWGFIAAIAVGSMGLLSTLRDPPLTLFFFQTGQFTPLFMTDLLFLFTQILVLYFGFRALGEKIISRSLRGGLPDPGGDLYE